MWREITNLKTVLNMIHPTKVVEIVCIHFEVLAWKRKKKTKAMSIKELLKLWNSTWITNGIPVSGKKLHSEMNHIKEDFENDHLNLYSNMNFMWFTAN